MARFLNSLIILILFPCIVWGYGNNITFEIIAPKAAGSGSPAIPSTHRCFRAYTGLTYTFRAQVIGGAYPYVFSLSNAPSGMSIDNHTGVITWTNPQSSASDITMNVYDRDGDLVQSTWSITVGTSGFYFVDDDAGSGGDGTIGTPFDSVDDIMSLNDEDGIVYWRAGTYTIPTYHSDYTSWDYTANLAYNSSPHIWIEYPGEAAIFSSGQILQCNEQTTPYYFEGMEFTSATEHVWVTSCLVDYFTIYNCEVDGLTTSRESNSNQGVIFTTDAPGAGYYLVIQDCIIHEYVGVAGIGSLYNTYKCLIEGNSFYNQSAGGSGICTAIAPKADVEYFTVRRNEVNVSSGSAMGSPDNGLFSLNQFNSEIYSTNIDICYNRFVSTGIYVHQFNNNGIQGPTWYYRNTCEGTWRITWLDASYIGRPEHNGPFYLDGNVIVNNNADTNDGGVYIDSGNDCTCDHITYHYNCGEDPIGCCMVFGTDLRGTTSDSIIDGSGNLTGSYTGYVGTYGWEIAEDEYYGSSPTPTCQGISIQ